MTEVTFDYEPRIQFIPFHQRTSRWSCLVCHRRAGKTVACVNDLTARASYTQKKNARFGYIAPYYRQAKEIAWQYLKDATKDIAVKVRESTLTVELFNGAKIQLFGADNPDAMRGLYFDGVVLDEFGDMKPSLWGEVILPTLSDRKGWAVFIGTPKGKNHFWQIYHRSREEGWFRMMLKASVSGILPREELEEMARQMSEDQYEQEFECSFEAAVVGTFYAATLNELEERGQLNCALADYDPEFQVNVATDLGFTDSTAFWYWQSRPDGFALIDYDEDAGQRLSYYFELLNNKGYDYDTIWLPHDAKARTLQTGRSTIEQFLEADFPVRLGAKLAIQDGINAARKILPSCYFSSKTVYGQECLRSYRREYDEMRKIFRDKPLHDWASNGADAFRYFALQVKERIIQPEEPGPAIFVPHQYCLEDLYEKPGGSASFQKLRI